MKIRFSIWEMSVSALDFLSELLACFHTICETNRGDFVIKIISRVIFAAGVGDLTVTISSQRTGLYAWSNKSWATSNHLHKITSMWKRSERLSKFTQHNWIGIIYGYLEAKLLFFKIYFSLLFYMYVFDWIFIAPVSTCSIYKYQCHDLTNKKWSILGFKCKFNEETTPCLYWI